MATIEKIRNRQNARDTLQASDFKTRLTWQEYRDSVAKIGKAVFELNERETATTEYYTARAELSSKVQRAYRLLYVENGDIDNCPTADKRDARFIAWAVSTTKRDRETKMLDLSTRSVGSLQGVLEDCLKYHLLEIAIPNPTANATIDKVITAYKKASAPTEDDKTTASAPTDGDKPETETTAPTDKVETEKPETTAPTEDDKTTKTSKSKTTETTEKKSA